MSWNIIIYKTGKMGEGIEPLGDLDRVTDALNRSFIALEWESPTTAQLPADMDGGFRVNLTTQNGRVQDIHTQGGTRHLREFAGLCTREGWRMAEAEQGEDINLHDPQKWFQERSVRPSRRRPTLRGQRPARKSRLVFKWIIWLVVLVGLGLLAFFLWRRNS